MAKQIKSVNGALVSYDELSAHVVQRTRIASVSYDKVNPKERKRGAKLIKLEMTNYCLCVLRIFFAYVWVRYGKVRSDVIWDGLHKYSACVVVKDGQNYCDTRRRFQYGQFENKFLYDGPRKIAWRS